MYFMNPILIAAAVVPAVILLVKVNKADRLEKESPSLLLSLVLFGVLSTALAALGERIGISVLGRFLPENSLIYNILLYFIVVGGSEEGSKYLLLRKKTWNHPEFNCQFDGVVYGVFVSLGFALWENIGYTAMYGLSTALVRAVTAIPGHACFGVFMGTWYGIAKKYDAAGNKAAAEQCRKRAVFIPLILHGIYDFTATYQNMLMSLVFTAFIVWMYSSAIRVVKRISTDDSYIVDNSGRNRFFF